MRSPVSGDQGLLTLLNLAFIESQILIPWMQKQKLADTPFVLEFLEFLANHFYPATRGKEKKCERLLRQTKLLFTLVQNPYLQSWNSRLSLYNNSNISVLFEAD